MHTSRREKAAVLIFRPRSIFHPETAVIQFKRRTKAASVLLNLFGKFLFLYFRHKFVSRPVLRVLIQTSRILKSFIRYASGV